MIQVLLNLFSLTLFDLPQGRLKKQLLLRTCSAKVDGTHHCSEHQALRHKLKSCTVPILYRSDSVKSRRMLYRPDVCNCTMPYVPRTVPAYAVRDPAYTAEVFALTLVKIDVRQYKKLKDTEL